MAEVGIEFFVLGVARQVFKEFYICLKFAVAAVVCLCSQTEYRRVVVYFIARSRIRHVAIPAAGDCAPEEYV